MKARHARSAAAVVCVLALAPCAAAEPVVYTVDARQSRIEFAVDYLGLSTARGRFERISGEIMVDRSGGEGRVELAIEADSVHTGWDLRDQFLRGGRMLDAERHPQIGFRSRTLAFTVGRLAAVDGLLTLRGVTHPARFEVTRLECGEGREGASDTCAATVAGRISRAAFGMDFLYPLIADDIRLEFGIVAGREGVADARP